MLGHGSELREFRRLHRDSILAVLLPGVRVYLKESDRFELDRQLRGPGLHAPCGDFDHVSVRHRQLCAAPHRGKE